MDYITNYHIWNGERDFERYGKLDSFYSSIKNRFMKQGTYNWSVKEFDIFVEKNNFDYYNCVTVLEDYCELYGKKFKVSKGLIKFVSVLRGRKGAQHLQKREGINISPNNEKSIKKFIFDYTNFLTNRTNLSREGAFRKISEDFATGYAESSIHDIFYRDKEFEPDPKGRKGA